MSMSEDLQREMKRVVRHFQRFDADTRANRAASHRLGPRQRQAVGEHYYSHPDVPDVAFPRRKDAAEAALRQPKPATDPAEPYAAALRRLNLPADWRWRVELRPRRKSAGAEVLPGGEIVFVLPPTVTPERFAAGVAGTVGQLARSVQDRSRFSATRPVKELVGGESFPWLGRNHRLRITQPGPQECCRMCREQVIRDPAVPVLAERVHAAGLSSRPSYWLSVLPSALNAEAIIAWYRQQGQAWVDEHAPEWVQRLDPARGLRIVVRDLGRRRWGVYRTRKHQVELHWALFQLDREFVEHTLVHELAHATRPGGQPHGPQWQAVFSRVKPDWRETARRMAEAGDRVWLGDVTGQTTQTSYAERMQALIVVCPTCDGNGTGWASIKGPTCAAGQCPDCKGGGEVTREKRERLLAARADRALAPAQPDCDAPATPERECRKAKKRPIPFDCKQGAGHLGECSPYTLPPQGSYVAPRPPQPDPWGPTIRALRAS
ncbi:SprT-like domain-containing protein [Micromonospora sp. NPDC049366]|uniref:SprT-like domain-containing protein n=1 Tax=Micromonospora sp. NPDC049366 TaxID=3364271 RepID=UPI0037B1B136